MKRKKILRIKKYLNIVIDQRRINGKFAFSVSSYLRTNISHVNIEGIAVGIFSFKPSYRRQIINNKYRYILTEYTDDDGRGCGYIPNSINGFQKEKYFKTRNNSVIENVFPDPYVSIAIYLKDFGRVEW